MSPTVVKRVIPFVKAQRRHKKAALEETDEEVDTEEYDSDSSETTTPDEELSGKGNSIVHCWGHKYKIYYAQ